MPALTTDMIPGPPRLAVDHVGAGSLVIFLHSIGGNRTNWHDQLGEIGGHFHAVGTRAATARATITPALSISVISPLIWGV